MTHDQLAPMFIAAERLRDLMRDQMAWIEQYLAEPNSSYIPMLLVLTKAGLEAPEEMTMMALAIPFSEDDEKRQAMQQIGRSIFEARKIPLAAIMSTEVWMAPDHKGVEPRHHPERQEGIACFASTLDGKHQGIAHLPVTRNAANNFVPGEWSEIHEEGVQCWILQQMFKGFYLAGTANMRN